MHDNGLFDARQFAQKTVNQIQQFLGRTTSCRKNGLFERFGRALDADRRCSSHHCNAVRFSPSAGRNEHAFCLEFARVEFFLQNVVVFVKIVLENERDDAFGHFIVEHALVVRAFDPKTVQFFLQFGQALAARSTAALRLFVGRKRIIDKPERIFLWQTLFEFFAFLLFV